MLATAASGGFAAASAKRAPTAPVLGDWEGVGPHGLPLSFSLARVHRRLTISNLTVGDPLICDGRLVPTNADPFAHALYIGPGAPPLVRLGWRRDEIVIRVGMGAPFAPEWDGRLLGPRSATLSEPAPTREPSGCGWGSTRRLTWRLAPARRAPVTAGSWTGTVSGGEASGSVSIRVSPSARIVEWFAVSVRCPDGETQWEVGPATVGEFISPDGTFEEAHRPAKFSGRFGPGGTVTGTFLGVVSQGCGSGSLSFTAHPG